MESNRGRFFTGIVCKTGKYLLVTSHQEKDDGGWDVFQNQGSVSLIEESGKSQSSYKLDVWVFILKLKRFENNNKLQILAFFSNEKRGVMLLPLATKEDRIRDS